MGIAEEACNACTGFKDWTKIQKKKKPVAAPTPEESSTCPPDKDTLGRHTWTFLHTTASYYPENPTAHQQSSMSALLGALPLLYPCKWCASHLGEHIQAHPYAEAVKTRASLERWLCETHNEVNERLGKEIFNCDKVGERWRDGPASGEC